MGRRLFRRVLYGYDKKIGADLGAYLVLLV